MDALIVVVLLHCGVVEGLLRDSPTQLEWAAVTKDEQVQALAFIKKHEESGARVITIEVKDAKCGTST